MKYNMMYAADGGAGTGGAGEVSGATGNGTGGGQATGGTAGSETPPAGRTYSETELAALLQSEGDKRVTQALEKFQREQLPNLLKAAQTEAEKRAKLTAEQLAAADLEKKAQELADRVAAVTKQELRIKAHVTLTEGHYCGGDGHPGGKGGQDGGQRLPVWHSGRE